MRKRHKKLAFYICTLYNVRGKAVFDSADVPFGCQAKEGKRQLRPLYALYPKEQQQEVKNEYYKK